MKGQAWACVAVAWVAAWTGVDGAVQSRSSDPNTIVPYQDSVMMDVPNIPLGEPLGVETDTLGEPLNPDDFAMTNMIAHDPAEEDPNAEDPILLAGRLQGDIVVRDMQELMEYVQDTGPKARNAIKDETLKWTDGVVPYVISQSYTQAERKVIANAMDNFHKASCIRFKPHGGEVNHIHFYKSSGCSSSVGMKGGKQAVTIGPRCIYAGVVMHELMHALGFWHEHSRYDRNTKIRILTENIKPGMEYNFKAYGTDKIQTLGLDYDTDSILHYGRNAFTVRSDLDTIQPLQSGVTIGQRRGLSVIDKQKLNKLYCSKTSTSTAAVRPPPDPSMCTDSENHCQAWALAGECLKNPVYMEASCCASCSKSTVCKDHDKSCKPWAAKGECTKNPDYMTVYCAAACGTCGNNGGTGCQDYHPDCPGWARTRQCQVNPIYMLKNCKKSCKAC